MCLNYILSSPVGLEETKSHFHPLGLDSPSGNDKTGFDKVSSERSALKFRRAIMIFKSIPHFFLFCIVVSQTGFLKAEDPIVPALSKPEVELFIGQDKQAISDYVQSINIPPSGFMTYTSIQDLTGLEEPSDVGAGVQHAQYLLDLNPDLQVQMGLYMVGVWEDVVAGLYDENIEKLGEWIKNVKTKVYLRIGYDFDVPENKCNPGLYILAFQHVVDQLKKQEVTNVRYVWHSRNGNYMKDWYPGDDYVDVCAISYYQPRKVAPQMVAFAKLHQKPMMIAESAPKGIPMVEGEMAWELWFKTFFKFIKDNDIKFACYVNTDWDSQTLWGDQKWGDTRVQFNNDIKSKWLTAIQQAPFIYKGALVNDEKLFPTAGEVNSNQDVPSQSSEVSQVQSSN